MTRLRTAIACAVASCLVAAAVGGCSSQQSKGDNWTLQRLSRPAQVSDAPRVYQESGCGKCHGSITEGGGSAPSLAHEGSAHDVAWIADQIRYPKAHKPDSTMPSYADDTKYAYGNMQALATALWNQK